MGAEVAGCEKARSALGFVVGALTRREGLGELQGRANSHHL